MVRYLFYTIGDLTYQSPLVYLYSPYMTSWQGQRKLYPAYLFFRGVRGGAVVEALRYKPEGRGFDSRWCHWNFSLT